MRSKVLHYIRERGLMRAGDRVAVAVSGGADSVALLRVLLDLRAELGIVLAVAHFNHGLRGADSDADEAFVGDLGQQHSLEFFVGRGDVCSYAATKKLSIEAAGRELRYEWLARLAQEQRFASVATAHTLDDQAETVLLKFLRGAGTRGLAGIHPELRLNRARIVRPLLQAGRQDVIQYLQVLGQSWREDESNLNRHHLRNRVRQDLLPLLERDYNPSVRRILSETAEIAQAEEEYWQMKAEPYLDVWQKDPGRLQLYDFFCFPAGLLIEPISFQRHVLKRFLERRGLPTDFHHVEAVRRCMTGKIPNANLPGGWRARRQGDWLELSGPTELISESTKSYERSLSLPGQCVIPEVGLTLRATVIPAEAAQNETPGTLLQLERLGQKLTVRDWHPGDRFWPLHRGAEEKLKRLFAEKQIRAERRSAWPVVLCGEQIVWVRGLPVARASAWTGHGDAVKISIEE